MAGDQLALGSGQCGNLCLDFIVERFELRNVGGSIGSKRLFFVRHRRNQPITDVLGHDDCIGDIVPNVWVGFVTGHQRCYPGTCGNLGRFTARRTIQISKPWLKSDA